MCVEQDKIPTDVQIKSTTKLADAVRPVMLNGYLCSHGLWQSFLSTASSKTAKVVIPLRRLGKGTVYGTYAHPHNGMYQVSKNCCHFILSIHLEFMCDFML